MKNKKGFTLVELLAVIAILAVLVLLAMPNVLKLFNEAKKSSFISEAQEIAKTSTSKYVKESLSGKRVNKISSEDDTKLDLSGGDVDYYLELDNKGNITYLEVSNDSFCLQTGKNYKDITSEDVVDGKCTLESRNTALDSIKYGTKIFVSVDGNDETGDGTIDNPVATVSRASEILESNNGIIYLLTDIDEPGVTLNNHNTINLKGYDGVKTLSHTDCSSDAWISTVLEVTDGTGIVLNDITLDGNNCASVLSIDDGCSAIINSGTSIVNGRGYDWSGVCITNYGDITMNDGIIDNCHGARGSGVSMGGGTFTLNNGTISNCSSRGSGFAEINGGIFTMNNGTISDIDGGMNYDGGGAFGVKNSAELIVNGGTFIDIVARNGGGIYSRDNSKVTVNGGRFENIQTHTGGQGSGGAIYVENSYFEVKNAEFIGNSSSLGGAINSNKGILIDNCTFKDNYAGVGGGAVSIYGGPAIIKNSLFEENEGAYSGTINIQTDEVTLDNVTIINNKTNKDRSAALSLVSVSKISLNNCTIKDNKNGMGSYNLQASLPTTTTVISNNSTVTGDCMNGSNFVKCNTIFK